MGRQASLESSQTYAFEAVAEDLRRRVQEGEWAVGERLPTVDQIAEQYPHSRVTINRALQTLGEQGYLSLDPGRGIHVLARRAPTRLGLLVGPSLLESPTQPFAATLARAARDDLESRGVEHRLYIEQEELLRTGLPCRNLQRDLEANWLHGLITAHANAPSHLHYSGLWRRRRLPLVNIGTHGRVAHCVTGEAGAALELSLGLVRERGVREAAILSHSGIGPERLRALLARHGCSSRPEWVQQPSLAVAAEERGYLDTRLLWEAREKPPALVILDDVVAKGAMQALLELRVRVPEDLCLVHTVNRGAGIFYPLAAPRVEYDPADFVGRAADLLLELLAEPELPPRTVYVTPRLRLEDGTIRSL